MPDSTFRPSPHPAAKLPRVVDVDIFLKSAGPPADFEVKSCLPVDGEDRLVFKNNHRPGFEIHFNLHDLTGEGYRFPSPPHMKDYAVWSKLGANCPTTACFDVFEAKRVEHGGLTLVVKNENPEKPGGGGGLGFFKFALNVTKDNGAHYLPLDPGGDDQNGARSFFVQR